MQSKKRPTSHRAFLTLMGLPISLVISVEPPKRQALSSSQDARLLGTLVVCLAHYLHRGDNIKVQSSPAVGQTLVQGLYEKI